MALTSGMRLTSGMALTSGYTPLTSGETDLNLNLTYGIPDKILKYEKWK